MADHAAVRAHLPIQAPAEWREGKAGRMDPCPCCGWSDELIDYYGSYRAWLAVQAAKEGE